jgi:NADPH-dependent glutamate synthase beta subunit-like oxidoreductase
MDASRSAIRLGAEEVVVLYRRSRSELLVDEEEVHDAQDEGVRFQFLVSPVSVEGDANGAVTGISCVRNRLGPPDASGRRRPEPIPSSLFTMEVDTVIEAIGQAPDTSFLSDGVTVDVNNRGLVEVSQDDLMTSVPGVFAGGDYVTGPRTVIEAAEDGRLFADCDLPSEKEVAI